MRYGVISSSKEGRTRRTLSINEVEYLVRLETWLKSFRPFRVQSESIRTVAINPRRESRGLGCLRRRHRNSNHLSPHQLSVLQPDIIGVDYLPGGYGSQYGRTMGGVVDIKTKRKIDEAKLTFEVTSLTAKCFPS